MATYENFQDTAPMDSASKNNKTHNLNMKISTETPIFRPDPLDREAIREGQVVAFDYYELDDAGQHGVAVMAEGGNYFYMAYNLYRPEGIWYGDHMPEGLPLYPPTEEDMILALDHLDTFDGDTIQPLAESSISEALQRARRGVGLWLDELRKAIEKERTLHERVQAHLRRINKEKDAYAERGREAWREERKGFEKQVDALEGQLADLKHQLDESRKKVDELQQTPTEEDFVKRLLKETKRLFKRDVAKADAVRQLFYKVGRDDAAESIDAWIDGNQKPLVSIERAEDVIAAGGKKIVNNT